MDNGCGVKRMPRRPLFEEGSDRDRDLDPHGKFTHFLAHLLELYEYLTDVKEVIGRRSGLKIV